MITDAKRLKIQGLKINGLKLNDKTRGEHTKQLIIQAALEIASSEGLDGITIGGLADKIGMSKSGVFAHFGSRDDLQKATLRAYSAYFSDVVLRTAIAEPRGLPRLVAIFNRWAELVSTDGKGCILISSASEFDDRPGAIRDELIYWVTAWQKELYTAIMQSIQCHHLPETIDIEQLVFELYGLILILHHDARLLRSANSLSRAKAGLKRLLASYAS